MADLCRHIDLVELLRTEGYAPKGTGGGRHSLTCPFHEDKNPSFVVYPNNTFHCFSCARNGDAIDLIRELKNLSFKAALNYLNINYTKVKRIVKKPDMLQTIADEERDGVDVLLKYGKELIDTLMFKRIKKEVKKHEK